MLDFSRQLTFSGVLKYLIWRVKGRPDGVTLSLKHGNKINLTRKDYGAAYEIYVHKYYQAVRPMPKDIRLIVDLGANVGYSALYFMQSYPGAEIIAFEPHVQHVERLKHNLAVNGSLDRVKLHAAAAGNADRQSLLSDRGMSSALVKHDAPGARPVPVMDIFPLLEGKHIDIFKMDIEGGEYDILADDRFLRLNIDAIVMEWHERANLPSRSWVIDRLAQADFEVREIYDTPACGMLWGFKKTGASPIGVTSGPEGHARTP